MSNSPAKRPQPSLVPNPWPWACRAEHKKLHVAQMHHLINLGGDIVGELDAGEVLGRQIGRVSILVDSAHQEHVTRIESVNNQSIEIRR